MHPMVSIMAAYFIPYLFPILGLLTGVFVLTGTRPQQLDFSAARIVTSPRLYPTQARHDENRREMFGDRVHRSLIVARTSIPSLNPARHRPAGSQAPRRM